MPDVLHDSMQLARHGAAIHWLVEREKRPVENDWSNLPVNTVADLKLSYRPGYNLGLRTGKPSAVSKGLYLYVLDLDVKGDRKDADEAYAALAEMLPDWERFPYVKSGRGGESIHIYCVCDDDLQSKKLRHSNNRVKWTDHTGKEKSSWAWEIERFGTGKQVAIPPSIHPETGNAYAWGKEVDWDDLDSIYVDLKEIGPTADEWSEESSTRSSTRKDDSSGSLSDYVKSRPIGLSMGEAWEILRDLDRDKWAFDYEGWLKAGMAIHHEFEGTAEGLDLYHDFSKLADNYDANAVEEKWASFGKDKRRRPVRFATLIAASAHKKLRREHSGADDDDPLDDENDPDAWLSDLSLSDKGTVESTSDNLSLIIANDVRFKSTFGRNRFIEDICIIQKPPKKVARSEKKQHKMRQLDSWLWSMTPTEAREGRPIEDDHMDAIRACIEAPVNRGGYRLKVSDRDLRAAINNSSNDNPYHPVQNWLESLEWDGKPRMDYLFIDYLGCLEDEYHKQTAALWLLAAVARAYQPGHKFDFVPILEGVQGIRKSTFIRYLAMHWFVELNCPFDDPKKVVETLVGSWLAEIPELSQFSRSEVGAIKAFFSSGEEKVREAYGRKAKRFPRQSVYMGTTNDREYLRDPTGNRRFWPIKIVVDQIDTSALKEAVPQIWAEVVERYKKLAAEHPPGSLPLYLTGGARGTALELQESRRIETQADGWAGKISSWANKRVRQSEIDGLGDKFENREGDDALVLREIICGMQVWNEALNGSDESYGRGNSVKVIEAIRGTGEWVEFDRKIMPVYGRQRVFKRLKKSKADLLA